MIECINGQTDQETYEVCECKDKRCIGDCMISRAKAWASYEAQILSKLAEDSDDIAVYSELAEQYQIIEEAIKNIIRLGEEI